MSHVSPTMLNNLVTMGLCAEKDQRQAIGEPYTIPDEEVRLLRAKVILEEALETIYALGCGVISNAQGLQACIDPDIDQSEIDLEAIIDGCCDGIYVACGTLASCGVPDEPHLREVCSANLDKFPKGIATFREDGKFLKPLDWEGPNHSYVQGSIGHLPPLKELASKQIQIFKDREQHK